MKADQFEGLRYNLAQMKLDGKDRIVLPVETLEALLDACQPPKSGTNEDALLEDVDRMRAKIHRMAEVLRRAKSTLEIGREFAHDREEMVNNWSGHADIVERMIDEALAYVPSEPHKPGPSELPPMTRDEEIAGRHAYLMEGRGNDIAHKVGCPAREVRNSVCTCGLEPPSENSI